MGDKPAIDSQYAPLFAAFAEMPPASSRTLEELRAVWDLSVFGNPEAVTNVRDLKIPVDGGTIPARLYTSNDKPFGLIVYYHGGGWVFGNLETHDLPLRALANRTGAAILSVEYRLAPEHPFPVGLQDCYAALVWANEHQADLTGKAVPLLIGGDSAGGNLTAAVALMARDGKGPLIDGQLLLYPSTDGRCSTPSFTEHAEDGVLLTSRDMRWYWGHYIAKESERLNPLASPCEAESHRGLPPAIVVVAEFDPLRDEGEAYAAKLKAAGNEVTMLKYETLPHGFLSSLYLVDAAGVAFREIAFHVCRVIASAKPKS